MPPSIPPALIETILTRLTALFLVGAAGDPNAARQAAYQLLASYHPETTHELRHTANIILFSFQALEALAQSATPDMSLTRILRLRGSAVSLNREAAKSEKRLTQLQHARQNPDQPQPEPEPAPPAPKLDKAATLIQDTATVAAMAKANGLTWTQAYNQRQRDNRLAAARQKAEARRSAQAKSSQDTPSEPAPDPAEHNDRHVIAGNPRTGY